MRNIALLIRKDFFSATASYGSFAFLLAIWLVLIGFVPNMAPMMFIMTVYVLVVALFQAEENDLVCNIGGVLPIRRSQAVLARYLYSYLVVAAQLVVSVILCSIVAFARGTDASWTGYVILGVSASLLLAAIVMPLIYKLGVLKSRIAMLVMYIGAIGASTAASPLLSAYDQEWNLSVLPPAAVILVACIVLSLISLAVSLRIAEHR